MAFTHRFLHFTRLTNLHRYRLHRVELNAIADPEQRHRRLVELNVIEQCLNLFKTGAVQRRRVTTYMEGGEYTTPRIHACVFDPNTGDMKRLVVSNKKRARQSQENTNTNTNRYSHATFFCFAIIYCLRMQVNFKEFIDDLHDIYDLYTLGDENVIEDKPHAPQEAAPNVASDPRNTNGSYESH